MPDSRLCIHCEKPLVEYSRNEYYIFYICACNRNVGVKWDWSSRLIDGIEYPLGSAGSFVHVCPSCGGVAYRESISKELCVLCRNACVEVAVITETTGDTQ
ncbi:MAG: hypothetical protein KAS32_24850 [Candidatus Peribacteraceae bacterium]|nr:hypothetical protein [Candidatus Peribacteraceae bacterium]